MNNIVELIKEFRLIASNAEIKEDENKLTIDAKNFEISKEMIKNFSSAGEEFIKLNIGQTNLFNLDDDDDIKEYIMDPNNYILEILIDKKEFIKKNIGNNLKGKIVLYLTEEEYYNNLEIILKEEKYNYIICPGEEYYNSENFIVTNLKRDFKEDILNTRFNLEDLEVKYREIKNLCNLSGVKNIVVPERFYVNFLDENFCVEENSKQIIKKLTVNSVIKAIANFTEDIDGIIKSKVISNKTININFNIENEKYTDEAYEDLYWIYQWIYKDSITDKISVTRNVIEALISAKWHKGCPNKVLDVILENTGWIKKSITDNFDKIIQGNVKDYFKEKNNIMKFLKDDLKSINDSIMEIIKNMNTNLVAGIGVLIAGSVGYIAKQDLAMVKIVIFLYAVYITISLALNLPLIQYNKNIKVNEFEQKRSRYIDEYLEDEEIKNIIVNKEKHMGLYKKYFVIYIVLVSIIDIMCILTIFCNSFVEFIVSLF